MGTSTGEIGLLRVKEQSRAQSVQPPEVPALAPPYEDVNAALRKESSPRSTRAAAPRAQAVGAE